MARKKKGRRKPKPSLIMLISIGAALIATVMHAKASGNKAASLLESVTGYWYPDGTFNWKQARFTIPVVGGAIAKKVVNMTGASRYFRGLPFTA